MPGPNRFRGRKSLADTKRDNNAAMRFLLGAEGIAAHPEVLSTVKPKRGRAAPKPGRILEKDVLADCLAALRSDRRVAMVERQQSGVFVEGNRHIRVGTRGALDIKGFLHGGRYFEIECKRPGENPDERQRDRIEAIRANGGISGFATSAAEALALLP